MDREESPYRRGNRYDVLPIPMIPAHCHPVDAGPVRFVVESRSLTNAILDETYAGIEMPHFDIAFELERINSRRRTIWQLYSSSYIQQRWQFDVPHRDVLVTNRNGAFVNQVSIA